MSNPAYGQETPGTVASEYNTLAFVIGQMLAAVQTMTLAKVISCTNSGALSPVGTVVIQPIINQMTGNRQAVEHGQIAQVPYVRIQGGANAIILDPKPGDVGVVGFCSRDIAAAKVARGGPVNPASFAMFDWADGIYLGNIFGGIPTQSIAFRAGIFADTPVLSTTANLSVGTGATGTFTTSTGQTVTVQDGIIVSIV